MTPPLIFEHVPLRDGAAASISLEVPAHRAVSIVGEEDSGIGDLGPFALGLRRPPRGRVLVYGQDITALPRRSALAFRRTVGYLPPGDGLLQNLSLRDNVALPLRFGSSFSNREIDGRIQVMLVAAGVSAAAHLRPAEANEVLRRRAAIARALAFDPKLVILEQPFNGLSNRAAKEMLELARGGDYAEGSRRTVFVTGQALPDTLNPRIEIRYRVVGDELRLEG